MAELFLIRHGQASFGKQEYDALSELGCQQAQVLGRYIAKIIKPTQLICGSLIRQQQTMDNLVAGYEDATKSSIGLPIKINPDFNELDHKDVLRVFDSRFESPDFITKEIFAQKDAPKVFHKLYSQAILDWINESSTQYKEDYASFYRRVNGAVQGIIHSAERKERVVVVSSAGSISMCLQEVLGISAVKAFELNEVMANTAITRFVFNDEGRLNLSYYNNYQHLSLSDIAVTYR